jgi:hypothetical protein
MAVHSPLLFSDESLLSGEAFYKDSIKIQINRLLLKFQAGGDLVLFAFGWLFYLTPGPSPARTIVD